MPTTTDELGHEVTPVPGFGRLRDRSWGIRIYEPGDWTGREVEVARHSRGDSTRVRLTQRVAQYRSNTRPALYRFQDVDAAQDTTRASDGASVAQDAPGTPMPAPVADNRTGRMLLAGGITCTVTLPDGQHVTLRISSRRRTVRDGWSNCQPTDDGARVSIYVGRDGRRIGRILPGWRVQLFGTSDQVRDAIAQLFAVASGADVELIGGELALSGYRIQVADRCGRCRRELTDPTSIDRGIGPECWGHSTGSHHAPVTGAVSEAVAPAPAPDARVMTASGPLPTWMAAPAPAPASDSLSALLAAEPIEDEADAYLATHPVDDDNAADTTTTTTAEPAPTTTTTATAEPALTGADVALARNTIAAAFRSRSPRQLRALAIFDRLAEGI